MSELFENRMDELTIEDLLKNNHFTVPEIQREYVWGSAEKLVTRFLDDITDALSKKDDAKYNIGFLYSYKHSNSEEYLIDGQQRLTTLVLFAIYLTKYASNNQASSDSNFINDVLRANEPHPSFCYRVRASAVTFLQLISLRPLCFDCERISDEIKSKTWYVSCIFDNDTTVKNMLKTLDIIHQWVKGRNDDKHPIPTAGEILSNVTFWHFNTGQTSQGEELYISMNSRGCPLTDAEQIKPLLFEKLEALSKSDTQSSTSKKYLDYGKKWDEWENFFFSIRNGRKVTDVDTAMRMLIRLIVEINTSTQHDELKAREDINNLSLEDIEIYMKFITELHNEGFASQVCMLFGDTKQDARLFVLKSLLAEKKRGNPIKRDLTRICNIVSNGVRRGKINHIPLLQFLNDFSNNKTQSFYNFIESHEELCEKVFNGHELEKIKLYNRQQSNDLEEACWKAEEHILWGGKIVHLLKWSSKEDGTIDLSLFNEYEAKIERLFVNGSDHPIVLDETRRALLTRELTNYPLLNYHPYAKFGYQTAEWISIIDANSDKIKDFLDEFSSAQDITKESVASHINKDFNKNFAEVAHHEYLLDYCNFKHLYWSEEWFLIKNQWAKPFSVMNKHLYERYKNDPLFIENNWQIWEYINWQSRVVIENSAKDIVFNVWILRLEGKETPSRYNVELFRRMTDMDKIGEVIAIPNSWKPILNEETERIDSFHFESGSEEEVINQIKSLIKS